MIKKCKDGCCELLTSKYETSSKPGERKYNHKAGVLLYDSTEESVLIVQSRGNLWGIPKGTLEPSETYIEGAIREVMEETGIDLSGVVFDKSINIGVNSLYFFLEYVKCEVSIQTSPGNDANSIGWIKLKCLTEMIKDGDISLTRHASIILKSFLGFE